MNQSIRSKIVIPVLIMLAITALIVALAVRWQHSPQQASGTPNAEDTVIPAETPVRLDVWKRERAFTLTRRLDDRRRASR